VSEWYRKTKGVLLGRLTGRVVACFALRPFDLEHPVNDDEDFS
jgi:hypothetical protein